VRPEIRLREFVEIAGLLMEEPDAGRRLQVLLQAVMDLTGAQRGFIAAGGATRSLPDNAGRPSRTILDRAMAAAHPLVLADAMADVPFSAAASVQRQRVRSVFAAPLVSGAETIGVLCLDHTEMPNLFGADDLHLLSGVAAMAGAALGLALRGSAPVRKRTGGLILGRSAALRASLETLHRIADLPYPVHIHGESGTGKELFARALHGGDGAFIAVNCGAIPPTIAESACFGHVRGAFSGAERDQAGFFEMADGGTLFLDEAEAMAPQLQEKLLRVLQDGEVRRVGSPSARAVRVRVVSASNENLPALVAAGKFRTDLFHRLDVLRIDVPPLRDRAGDIPLLAAHFLDQFAKETGRARPALTQEAIDFLSVQPWPGNVRQLQNALRRAAALDRGGTLDVADFEFLARSSEGNDADVLLSLDDYLRRAVLAYEGRLSFAEIARQLGVSRKNLWERRRRWLKA